MTGFKLQTFGARRPRSSPVFTRGHGTNSNQRKARLRETGAVEKAMKIRPSPLLQSYAITGSTKTLFKYSNSIWIGRNEDVDFVRSPLAEDQRTYICYWDWVLLAILG